MPPLTLSAKNLVSFLTFVQEGGNNRYIAKLAMVAVDIRKILLFFFILVFIMGVNGKNHNFVHSIAKTAKIFEYLISFTLS